MEISVPFGRSTATARLPDGLTVDVIEPPGVAPAVAPIAAVGDALDHPLGDFSWSDVAAARSVAIAVNDKTRPVPHADLLPPLLDRLALAGVPPDAITFLVAVGAHPPTPPSELGAILPREIVDRYRVRSHDADHADGLVSVGTTRRGTPVLVNRRFTAADLRIVVGTIAPHQFVGFSGGVKTAAIGLAGRTTITANHTLMAEPGALVAAYADNPARQDVEEIGAIVGVHLALNAILDAHGRVVRVLAGDPVAVMEAGVPAVRSLCQVRVDREYDVVVTSPGGHPKDVDVYQSQKAVATAARIVRPGGTIVLVAACPDGAGSPHYEAWVADKRDHSEVLAAFRAEGFRLGPHKAFQIARDAQRARLLVCSEMPDELARRLLLDPVDDLQSAVDLALAVAADQAAAWRIAVLPHATITVPDVDLT
jgi:nickel-dependent lactate racemase